MLITLSGRGDKDVAQVREIFGRADRAERRCLRRRCGRSGRSGRKLLIPYLMGGMTEDWGQTLAAVVAAGADAVEVGIPFSDPMMDGPVIQEAALRALERGTVPDEVLDGIARAEVTVPVAVMTYYNIVYRAGHKRMAHSLVEAGVSGAIIPDLSLEEVGPWAEEADAAGVETVLLVAPSSPEDRVERICARARGFVYAVARMGVTGERADVGDEARPRGRADPPPHRHAGLRRCGGVDPRAGGRGLRGGRRRGGGLGPGAPAARGRRPRGGGRVRGSLRRAID